MKWTIYLTFFIVLISCQQKKSAQLLLKTKLKDFKNEINLLPINKSSSIEINYVSYHPCSFYIKLPSHLSIEAIEEEDNFDYCDYSVKTKSGFEVMQIHSLINSRFESDSIKELYQNALKDSELDITYHIQKNNWFIISGIRKNNTALVYWKRVLGNHFISDLHIEYLKNKESEILPYIKTISSSFTSD